MIAKDGSVVRFNYQIFDTDGLLVEESDTKAPATYLHGYNNMMPSLEALIEGKTIGDKIEALLEPKDAYGERKDQVPVRVPIKHLISAPKRLRPGLVVNVKTEQGASAATVVKVGRFNVDLDTNHPLAGKTLDFKIEIVEIREATAEEIAHGHVHGQGGHHH